MTKRIVAKLSAAALILAMCAGCVPRTSDVAKGESFANDPVVYRDSVTGCEYLTTSQLPALTPRVDASGKHICKTIARAEAAQ